MSPSGGRRGARTRRKYRRRRSAESTWGSAERAGRGTVRGAVGGARGAPWARVDRSTATDRTAREGATDEPRPRRTNRAGGPDPRRASERRSPPAWPGPAPPWASTDATPAAWRRASENCAPRCRTGSSCRSRADLGTAEGAERALETLPDVDILVNNLGVFGAVPALEISDDEWRRYFEINVLAGVRLTRAHLPRMRERGWGRVLYIASDSAVVVPAEMIHYGVSKTALLAVSRGFAKEAAGSGVTVNSVIAGPTHTEGRRGLRVPAGRPGAALGRGPARLHARAPPAVAAPAADRARGDRQPRGVPELAQASATTGAAVRVDGGYVDSILP